MVSFLYKVELKEQMAGRSSKVGSLTKSIKLRGEKWYLEGKINQKKQYSLRAYCICLSYLGILSLKKGFFFFFCSSNIYIVC